MGRNVSNERAPALSRLQKLGVFAAVGSFLVASLVITPISVWSFFHPAVPDRSGTVRDLSDFYLEADRLFLKGVFLPKATTPEEYREYSKEVEAFSERFDTWLAANMSPTARARMLQYDPALNLVSIKEPLNEDHRATLVALLQTKAGIEALMKNATWDKLK